MDANCQVVKHAGMMKRLEKYQVGNNLINDWQMLIPQNHNQKY